MADFPPQDFATVPLSSQTPAAPFVDLASTTAWQLSVDRGPSRSVNVPGGGYNSDRQAKPWIDSRTVRDAERPSNSHNLHLADSS